MDTNIKINCETNGFEDATEKIETLAEAYDGFPAQVTVKNCRNCTINIHPSQTKIIEAGEAVSRGLKAGIKEGAEE